MKLRANCEIPTLISHGLEQRTEGKKSPMSDPIRFLHITDTHITGEGVPFKRDDLKVRAKDIDHPTRESALTLTLHRLSEWLKDLGHRLDGVIFSGDATLKGAVSGHKALLDILLSSLGSVGITAERIVATPGNHDIPVGTDPGSPERYKAFLDVWRGAGCITPWLDGIDPDNTSTPEMHRLVDERGRWAVYPFNSANWSHVDSELEASLAEVWADLHKAAKNPAGATEVRKLLDKLARYDMARISDDQFEELRHIVNSTPVTAGQKQVRILTLHHHLSAPSLREEVKPFADFTNLQLLRSTLRERLIDVVMHGHKHQHAARFEYIYGENGEEAGIPRRTLVLSGATFDGALDQDAARLVTMDGLPFAPQLTTVPIPVPRGGTELHLGNGERFRLWSNDWKAGGPAVVQGSDLNMVYHQACVVAAEEAKDGTLIVDLDLPPDAEVRLPVGYPLPEGMTPEERDQWFRELVGWWQEKRSNLEQRIPYIHGNRLHRFGGVDQIERIKAMLKHKGSSRILATLIDPARDFRDGGRKERFSSFCLVQFRLRDETKTSLVDVVGYYRAQEFARWWPINVAELRALQVHVLKGTQLRPGRITTITAEARTIGRSPTQVAMPVIDRWLDQHPERLHVLANRLLGHACNEGLAALVQREWFQTLNDLEAAAAAYNEDGVPIPIDGLEALASYLEASKPAGEVKAFLTRLRALIKTNRAYETSGQTETDFDNWGARDLVPDLRASSEALFGIVAKGGST